MGSKVLLPQKTLRELHAIERAARKWLAEYAIETPFGAFVPYKPYQIWKKGNESFKERFFAKREEIRENYGELVNQLLAEYEQMAAHSYSLLREQQSDIVDSFPTQQAFVRYFRDEVILCNIKTADEFCDTFVYDVELSRIPFLGGREEGVEDEEVEELSLQYQAEEEAASSHKRMLDDMNRDLVANAREQKSTQIDAFFTAVVGQLRTLTYDVVSSVLTSIKGQGALEGRPAIALRNLVEQLGQLNFYEDKDITSIISTVQSIIDTPAKKRDVSQIQQQLRNIATVSRGTLLALEFPREEKDEEEELDIAVCPTDEQIREAREELSLAPLISIEADTREGREEGLDYARFILSSDKERAERTA
jgi:hypothetical protein